MFGIPEEIQLVIFHRGWNHTSDKMLRHEEGCVQYYFNNKSTALFVK